MFLFSNRRLFDGVYYTKSGRKEISQNLPIFFTISATTRVAFSNAAGFSLQIYQLLKSAGLLKYV